MARSMVGHPHVHVATTRTCESCGKYCSVSGPPCTSNHSNSAHSASVSGLSSCRVPINGSDWLLSIIAQSIGQNPHEWCQPRLHRGVERGRTLKHRQCSGRNIPFAFCSKSGKCEQRDTRDIQPKREALRSGISSVIPVLKCSGSCWLCRMSTYFAERPASAEKLRRDSLSRSRGLRHATPGRSQQARLPAFKLRRGLPASA